jgi:hypothetical protein
MPVKATVTLTTPEDALDTLESLVKRNERFIRAHGPVDLFSGLFKYRLEKKDKCGAERWETLEEMLQHPERPILGECEEWATILCALLRCQGKRARVRLIQIQETGHIQVVCEGRVLDPSVTLGMTVPPGLEKKIYRLDFTGTV